MNTTEYVFIDLSSIAYPIWHMSQSDPDPNKASREITRRVLALTNGHKHVAVCCDTGKSFRHDVSVAYKANRPAKDGTLMHQISLAKEAIEAEGFPVWGVSGFEADDLIATAVALTLEEPDRTALVATGDKDLLQLVGPRVRVINVKDGAMVNEAAVIAKLGVRPNQVRDYLTLCGDTSDNIQGAKGIGAKTAASILAKFGTLDDLYRQMKEQGPASLGLPPAITASLRAFEVTTMPTTRTLVTLREDVELPFHEITGERTSKVVDEAITSFASSVTEAPTVESAPNDAMTSEGAAPHLPQPDVASPGQGGGDPGQSERSTGLAVRGTQEVLPAPSEWERGLDPRSMDQARVLAKDLFDSRMFSAYGTPQGVLSTIMVGRELGLPAMASLRSIYNIEGKHSLSASLMAALVLKSGLAEFFEPIEISDKSVTFETKRRGARAPLKLTHTIEMGLQAWPKTKRDWQEAFNASGWGRNPTDMLVARCQARLARLVYPDLLAGLYTPEELEEIRMMAMAA